MTSSMTDSLLSSKPPASAKGHNSDGEDGFYIYCRKDGADGDLERIATVGPKAPMWSAWTDTASIAPRAAFNEHGAAFDARMPSAKTRPLRPWSFRFSIPKTAWQL